MGRALGLEQVLRLFHALEGEPGLSHADLGDDVVGVGARRRLEAGERLGVAAGSVEELAVADQRLHRLRVELEGRGEGLLGRGDARPRQVDAADQRVGVDEIRVARGAAHGGVLGDGLEERQRFGLALRGLPEQRGEKVARAGVRG